MVVVRCRACRQFYSWTRRRHQGEHYPSSLGVHCLATVGNIHRTICEHAHIHTTLTYRGTCLTLITTEHHSIFPLRQWHCHEQPVEDAGGSDDP